MKNLIVLLTLFILFLAGCSPSVAVSSSTPTLHTTSAPEKAVVSNPGMGSLFAINEVGLGPNGYVSLTNFTSQIASLGGLFLCQGTKCFELPNVNVAAGKRVRIAVADGAGLDDVIATKATIGTLLPSDGEVALYSSKNLKDPKAILVYLEWGSTPHEDTQVAIDSGLWLKGAFAPSSKNATRIYRNEGGLWLFDEK